MLVAFPCEWLMIGIGPGSPGVAGVHGGQNGILDNHAEIAIVLVQAANAHFQVLGKLVAIKCLAPNVDIGDPQGNGMGREFFMVRIIFRWRTHGFR